MEGLILVAFCLLILTFANGYSLEQLKQDNVPTVQYSITQDTNTLTLQQGTQGKVTFYFDFPYSGEYSLQFVPNASKGIVANITPKIKGLGKFSLPLYISVSDLAETGNYTLTLDTYVTFNGITKTEQKEISLNVIPKENFVFGTSKFTNELPNLVFVEASTGNLIVEAGKIYSLIFTVKNTGSPTTFFIVGAVNPQDENKIGLNYSAQYFHINQNETKSILVDINFAEDYSTYFAPIYFYAQDVITGNKFQLTQININLQTENNAPSIVVDTNTEDKNTENKKEPTPIVSSTTGLFGLGSGGWDLFIAIVIVIAVIFGIYKLFTSNTIFGQTVYVKDLKN